MNTKTAILVFANSAEKEAERKCFLSKEVFSTLNAQTLKTVEKSGFTYFHFSEKNQIGNTFGERFTNAIEAVFNKGFKNVITIGNDTPHLKTKHIHKAANLLKHKDWVLGPSIDGGFYLMGFQKNKFTKETLLKLPWLSNNLHNCIVKIADFKNINYSFLEILNDLDSKEDVLKIISSFKNITFLILQLLCAFIFIDKRTQNLHKLYTLEKYFSKNFNKGSPFIFG